MAIFDQTKTQTSDFQAPPLEQYTPPDMLDAVQRVVAAGMKLVYQGDLKDMVLDEVRRDVPTAQMLAEASVGWLLMLDKKAPQGIPENVMAPALQALVGEAAEISTNTGRPVSQDEFEEAVMLAHQVMAKKLGYTDEQIMQGARQAVGADEPQEPGMAEEGA